MQVSKGIYKYGTNEEISKADIGDILTFKVEILNENNKDIKTTVKDSLPQGITPIESTILNGGIYGNNIIIWEDLIIPSGGKTITYNAIVEDNIIGSKDLILTSSITNIDGKETSKAKKIDIDEIIINKIQTQLGQEQAEDVNIILVMDLSNSMNGETSDPGKW